MIKFYSRLLSPEEVKISEDVIYKIKRLKAIHSKVSLSRTLNNYNLKTNFIDKKNKDYWKNIKIICHAAEDSDFIIHDKLLFCVTLDSFSLYDLSSGQYEMLFKCSMLTNEWFCDIDLELDLNKITPTLNRLNKAYIKAETLHTCYENGQRKHKWSNTRSNYQYSSRGH
jgi:hypothetical protein